MTPMEEKVLQLEIQLSLARAEWWMHSATNGYCKKRKIYHGTYTESRYEHPFTDDEKVANAMETAERHIETAQDRIRYLAHLTRSEWGE